MGNSYFSDEYKNLIGKIFKKFASHKLLIIKLALKLVNKYLEGTNIDVDNSFFTNEKSNKNLGNMDNKSDMIIDDYTQNKD